MNIMNETIKKPLKNIKFNFLKEKKSLNFEEYNINNMNNINQFNVDSKILDESNRKEEFLNLIFDWSGFKNMVLLYRGTKDGMNSNNFHKKCDNQGKTIIKIYSIKITEKIINYLIIIVIILHIIFVF